MVTKLEKIENRRKEIIEEISRIESMRKGSLNEQFLKVPQKGKEPILRGPYYVLTRKENNKTKSSRINKGQYEETKEEIENYKYFINLSTEYAQITEELTDMKKRVRSEDSKKN